MFRPPSLFFFFFNDTATTEIYTLSLHDALPISRRRNVPRSRYHGGEPGGDCEAHRPAQGGPRRSEEHTSELQSRPHLVCRLLLEKKKKQETSSYTCARLESTSRSPSMGQHVQDC